MTMIESRGAGYVTNWPTNICQTRGIAEHFLVSAVKEVTGSNIDPHGAGIVDPTASLPVIGALDGPTAKRVADRAVELSREYAQKTHNSCRYCGQPMVHGQCRECV